MKTIEQQIFEAAEKNGEGLFNGGIHIIEGGPTFSYNKEYAIYMAAGHCIRVRKILGSDNEYHYSVHQNFDGFVDISEELLLKKLNAKLESKYTVVLRIRD